MMQVKFSQAKSMAVDILKAGLVPLVLGDPAIGKSSMGEEISNDFNLEMIDTRLDQADQVDLNGFPNIDKQKQRASYLPFDTFPIEGDPLPVGKDGWFMFLDEFPPQDRTVQKAAYKLILDRKVGKYNIHPDCAIMCAGNLVTSGAIAEELSSAMQSRLIQMQLVMDAEDWLEWAERNGIHYLITSYIHSKPQALYTFKVDQPGPYAAPRTWVFLDRLIKVAEAATGNFLAHPNMLQLAAGTISEGEARLFMGFSQLRDEVPTIAAIVASPMTVPVPNKPSVLWLLTGAIAASAKEQTLEPLMKYMNRMPKEFQVVTLRALVRRNADFKKHPAVAAWVMQNATELW